MPQLSLSLLGPFEARLDGDPITGFESNKVRALLAYLATEAHWYSGDQPGRPLRRETLAGLLWPDVTDSAALANLRNALANLRRAIDDRQARPPFLLITRETIQLNCDSDHAFDVATFAALVGTQGAQPAEKDLERAIDLYRGSFLQGFSVRGSPAFDDWCLILRERCQRQVLAALRCLVGCYEERGEYVRACDYAWREVELEPWQEESHRDLMRLLARSGQRSAALAQYEACCRQLAQELGVEPARETARLYERIREGELEEAPDGRPRAHNLPAQLVPFVGREREVIEIVGRLRDPACRLLTLTGPGGSGKTRLALEAAAQLVGDYEHGVFFVSLAPLRSAEAIVPAIAQALGFVFLAERDPRQQLLDYLGQKQVLLLLDNYEHLLADPTQTPCAEPALRDGANLAVEVLEYAPRVRVLVTSRARLNVRGESLYPVGGMELPPLPPESGEGGGEGQYSAVQLFIQRARRLRPEFVPTESDMRTVTQICRCVAGMPLGILLAAGWMGMLSPAEIASQLSEQSIDFLQTDWRDVPARQRNMRAVFDHSWGLLTERQQETFAGLSVFRGSFTRQAVQRVTGASLRVLEELVDRSLLHCSADGRYEIHELLRQYAAEKLAEIPERRTRALDLHCAYYAGFLRQREGTIVGGDQREALPEIDNIRAMWQWAVQCRKAEVIRESCHCLLRIHEVQGLYQEGRDTFERAADALRTDQATGQEGVAWASVLYCRGVSTLRLDDQSGMQSLLESRSILQELGARRELARVNVVLAFQGVYHRDPGSIALLEESLDTFTELDIPWGVTWTLNVLGWATEQSGALEEAERHCRRALSLSRELNYRAHSTWALSVLGGIAFEQGEYAKAMRYYEEGLSLAREIGFRGRMAQYFAWMGNVALAMGEYLEARRRYGQALAEHTHRGRYSRVAETFGQLGDVALAAQEVAEARRNYGQALGIAAEKRDEALSLHLMPGLATLSARTPDAGGARACNQERAVELAALALAHPASAAATKDKAEQQLAALRTQLSPGTFAAAQTRGQARDLWATVQELLDELGGD